MTSIHALRTTIKSSSLLKMWSYYRSGYSKESKFFIDHFYLLASIFLGLINFHCFQSPQRAYSKYHAILLDSTYQKPCSLLDLHLYVIPDLIHAVQMRELASHGCLTPKYMVRHNTPQRNTHYNNLSGLLMHAKLETYMQKLQCSIIMPLLLNESFYIHLLCSS